MCTTGLAAGGIAAALPGQASAAFTPPGHDTLVSAVPRAETPNVQNGSVDVILDAGEKIVAGGDFANVRSPGSGTDIARLNLFAFDEDTGVVDDGFKPVIDGVVHAIIAGPTPGTVYIGGRFSNVSGNARARNKVALLDVSDGSVVDSFRVPGVNGAVTDLALVGDRLLIGGNFTSVNGQPRGGLASVNATTGALDDYLTVALTENHSWTEGSEDVAKAAVGVQKVALSPDESQLVVIGNFRRANGALHDQIVKLDLGGTAATIADWNTARYEASCFPNRFDSYMRDVAFAPDGDFFVVVTTGGAHADTLCDSAARWEADETGSGRQPTWSSPSGGDTFLSVGVSETAVYVGGHMRWMNNAQGRDSAGPGAVPRASIAALEPVSGTPLSWNPGSNPRGVGITELYVTPQGLWIGHDQEWIGNQEYKRDRIAFFPLAGGAAVAGHGTPSLPGKVNTFGANPPARALLRVNAGGPLIVAADGGANWQADTAAAPSRYHNAGMRVFTQTTWIPAIKPPVSIATQREIFNDSIASSGTVPNINWNLPVARSTPVIVRLYFSTRCACAPGTRAFHINIDGVRKISNYDPTAAAGGSNIGTMLSYTITSDGNIDIDMLKVKGSPSVDAIEVFRTPAPPLVGHENKTFGRTYDGGTAVGAPTEFTAEAFPWSTARGGFMIGNRLYVAHGSLMYVWTFNGSTLGPRGSLNPYSDPKWDTVLTNSGPAGQTYKGVPPDYHYEVAGITGQFFEQGRLYYTIAGHSALYWRWFSPDSGVVGATRFTVAGSTGFADSGGVFVSDGRLYLVSRTTGNLNRMNWSNGTPSPPSAVVSGPTVDGRDWRAKVTFIGP